jgi:hypothetical protein
VDPEIVRKADLLEHLSSITDISKCLDPGFPQRSRLKIDNRGVEPFPNQHDYLIALERVFDKATSKTTLQ